MAIKEIDFADYRKKEAKNYSLHYKGPEKNIYRINKGHSLMVPLPGRFPREKGLTKKLDHRKE